jgi:multidrug efflux pump subunit AcrA (membrane-fusion protein)
MRIIFLFILIFSFECKSSEQFNLNMTFTVVPKDFTTTVDAEGILEAKNNRSIIAPQTPSYICTIVNLIPEGSEVKKGDVLITLQDAQLEKEYKNAIDGLETDKSKLKENVS